MVRVSLPEVVAAIDGRADAHSRAVVPAQAMSARVNLNIRGVQFS